LMIVNIAVASSPFGHENAGESLVKSHII